MDFSPSLSGATRFDIVFTVPTNWPRKSVLRAAKIHFCRGETFSRRANSVFGSRMPYMKILGFRYLNVHNRDLLYSYIWTREAFLIVSTDDYGVLKTK
jgi:hypothetical protein